jgi:hypothetical protein
MVRKIRQSGGAATAMLALVLLFRLMVPTGYMIGPDQGGRPGLVLCGAGPTVTPAPAQQHRHKGHPAAPAAPRSSELPCPYAALAAPPPPPAPPALLSPAPAPPSPPAVVPAESPGQPGPAAPPPPATGPPLPV